MGFNTVQREIILGYLNLGEDYKDIYEKVKEFKIDPIESNFLYHGTSIFRLAIYSRIKL